MNCKRILLMFQGKVIIIRIEVSWRLLRLKRVIYISSYKTISRFKKVITFPWFLYEIEYLNGINHNVGLALNLRYVHYSQFEPSNTVNNRLVECNSILYHWSAIYKFTMHTKIKWHIEKPTRVVLRKSN